MQSTIRSSYSLFWVFPGGSHSKKNTPAVQETWVQSLGLEDLEKGWQPTPVLLLGISHGQRNWWATVHVVAESDAMKWLTLVGCLHTLSLSCLPAKQGVPAYSLGWCAEERWWSTVDTAFSPHLLLSVSIHLVLFSSIPLLSHLGPSLFHCPVTFSLSWRQLRRVLKVLASQKGALGCGMQLLWLVGRGQLALWCEPGLCLGKGLGGGKEGSGEVWRAGVPWGVKAGQSGCLPTSPCWSLAVAPLKATSTCCHSCTSCWPLPGQTLCIFLFCYFPSSESPFVHCLSLFSFL